MTFVPSLTQMLVFLTLYVMLSIHLSILVNANIRGVIVEVNDTTVNLGITI